jgi:acid stress-induced BolA-like protein IbaG/YrbA
MFLQSDEKRMDPDDIKSLIEQNLPGSAAAVGTDGMGHYEATVVSAAFEGKRSIARHQMVYATLGQRVGREIHALQLKTFTPEEWRAAGG